MDVEVFFDEMYRYALIYGMTSEEFWFGNPQDYFIYADAFAEKTKIKHDEQDTLAWYQGEYNLLALEQALSDSFGKKGAHHNIFPKKPFSMKEQPKQNSNELMKAKFQQMATIINKKFNKE